jgi:hypothetical protein
LAQLKAYYIIICLSCSDIFVVRRFELPGDLFIWTTKKPPEQAQVVYIYLAAIKIINIGKNKTNNKAILSDHLPQFFYTFKNALFKFNYFILSDQSQN